MNATDSLQRNLDAVRARMRAACERAGRDADSVRLVAVTKYADPEHVRLLAQLGANCLGESRPQQLAARAADFPASVEWHLIGTLQRNKVRPVLPVAALIHSVDSVRLLARIDEVARELGLAPRVLLQVNVSREETKHGFDSSQLQADWSEIIRFEQVRVVGLMTMAPFWNDPEAARPTFAGLRRLRDELRNLSGAGDALPELSMGMSHDFEVAIEEGATFVRIGSLLFDGVEG